MPSRRDGLLDRRRRHSAGRDHLRHAQRQGGALRHRRDLRRARRSDVPVMISGTITDLSGRMLSGQTPEAFWNSVRHAAPLSIGLNCALGAEEMRAHIDEIGARRRHAGLRLSERRPAQRVRRATTKARSTWRRLIGEFAAAGLVNIVGGCCGTTPDHIARHRATPSRDKTPREIPEIDAAAAAVRPGAVHADAGNPVRERRRAHQRHRLGASSAS